MRRVVELRALWIGLAVWFVMDFSLGVLKIVTVEAAAKSLAQDVTIAIFLVVAWLLSKKVPKSMLEEMP